MRTFKKRGRPAEDRVTRRLEIFRAMAPELEQVGPTGLTMQRAADLAFVSIGTLYTYFDSKRSLVMYGLNPEPAGLICREFLASHGEPTSDTSAAVSAVFDLIIENVRLMRASARAVIEAGPEAVRERMEAVVRQPIPEFEGLLDAVGLGASRQSGSLEPVVRQLIGSALFDSELELRDFRRQLEALFRAGDPALTG